MAEPKLLPSPKSPIKVGIIGAGYGLSSLLPVLNSIPDYKVICVATKDGISQKTSNFPLNLNDIFYTTPNALIQNKDIELAVIASPPSTHEEYAIAAIESGKNIYCEKPVGLNSSSTNRIFQVSKTSNKICTVGYQFRFDPMIQWVKNQIKAKEIGKIVRAEIRWETSGAFKTPNVSWRNNLSSGGGVLRDFGSHVFDYLSYIEVISNRPGKWEEERSHNFKSKTGKGNIQDINFSGVFGEIEFHCIISRTCIDPIGHCIRFIGTHGEIHAHHHPPFGLGDLLLEVITKDEIRKYSPGDEGVSLEGKLFLFDQLDSRQMATGNLFFSLAQTIRGISDKSLPTLEDALFSQKLVEEAQSVLF